MAAAQRLADGAAAAAVSNVGKKKRSRSRRNSDDGDGDAPPKSQKQQRQRAVGAIAAPAMSAVAARKLALMKEQGEASKNNQNGQEQDKEDTEDARTYTAEAPSQGVAAVTTESEKKQEISALNDILDDNEEDDDGNDSDNMSPVASTSKLPAEKRSKRYFSANPHTPIESVRFASDVETEAVDDTIGPNASYSEPSTPLRPRRRAKRRRRGDDYKNAYFDPDCVSTWKPVLQQNCFHLQHQHDTTQKAVIIAMQPGETLMMKGIATLRILRGTVILDCGVLDTTSQPLTVFAPTTHPLPVLRASYAQSSSSAFPPQLHLPSDMRFEDRLEAYPVVILIQDTRTGLEGIEGVAKTAGMPVPINGFWTSQYTGPQAISGITFELITQPERDVTATLLPDNWMEALSKIGEIASEEASAAEEGHTCIVQGPKGVGKSTFAKMLVNRLLARYNTVAYIECDVGQTELTPPGLVSLHLLTQPLIGPAFTQTYRLHQAERAHYLGSVSPKNNPSLYLASIRDLLEQYGSLRDTADNPLPLVINTQGWVKGLGADLLGEIHQMATPSRIFDFSAPPDPSYSYTSLPQEEPPTTPTYFLQPMSQPADYVPTRLNPADLRTLNLISYLHLKTNQGSSSAPKWNFARSLVTKAPFAVSWHTFKQIRLLGSEHIVYDELLNALDVSIVSLESLDDPLAPNFEQPLAYDPQSPTQAPTGSCLGLGVIRAIDKSASTFHMHSSLPHKMLDKIKAISKGDIELPTVLLTDYINAPDDQEGVCGVPWKDVPYLESREDQQAGVGYTRRRIRRNVMRRSQFR